jgi:hypothetical protein
MVTIYTTRLYNKTILRSAHTVYLRALCGSENKQRLFPYTALTDRFIITEISPVKLSGYHMYRQFNIQQFCVLPTQFMCFVWISEQTAIISLYSINWPVYYNRD